MLYPGFINGSNPLASINVDSERSINWFPESTSPGTAKAPVWLAPVPGMRPFVVLSNGPVRGLWNQNGRAFAVAGSYFYELFANHTAILRGAVANDNRPVWMASNGSAGHQVFFASGGFGFYFDLTTNIFAQILDADFPLPCTMMAFVNGYALALKASSNQFQWSALEDASAWDALDVAQLSQTSDNIQTLIPVHGNIWLLGQQTSVVWQDTGGTAVFEPIAGSLMQMGTRAAFSAWAGDNALFWVGGNDQGQAVVYRGTGVGAAPQRVSTFSVEYDLNNVERLTDTIGWGYQENGHTFYLLYVPSLNRTWTFDLSMNIWHWRTVWNPVLLDDEPDLGRCHTFAFGTHLVGDRQSGAVYEQSFQFANVESVVLT